MDGKYDVTLNGQDMGTVEIRREGLYYRISCRCRVRDGEIHRLYADGEKLGVLIPERGELILETKVVAKRLKAGCTFTLDKSSGTFIPVRSGEPFAYLDKVRFGRLAFREGQPGLLLCE